MENKLEKIYFETLQEYNNTPLAKDEGWTREYSKYTFTQIKMINEVLIKDAKILDIGTGSGIVPIFFKKKNYNVITIDNFETGGNALSNINLFEIKNKNVDLNKGHLPFEDNEFDVINMGDVIEHLPNSPKKVMIECNRVLKKNGHILISTPNSIRLINRLKLMFGNSVWPKIETFYFKDYNETHHHEYTLKELKFVLNDNGFSIDKIKFFEENINIDNRLNSFYGKFIKILLNLTLNLIPKLKSNMIIRAKKN